MPVRARNLIRKMRGGAQAHLLEGEDGAFYVVKFMNNPQHRRILINEWLACAFLRYLQIHVPDTAVIELTREFIERNPDLYLSIGSRREQVLPGLHFGSRLAVHPDRVAVFDFLPDKLLNKIENRVDFLGALVFDKWVANADSRQAVFFRARAKVDALERRNARPNWVFRSDDRSWICIQRPALGVPGLSPSGAVLPNCRL
ncbi:MAG: HipA family kinase [Bryobacteraceae bacterium]